MQVKKVRSESSVNYRTYTVHNSCTEKSSSLCVTVPVGGVPKKLSVGEREGTELLDVLLKVGGVVAGEAVGIVEEVVLCVGEAVGTVEEVVSCVGEAVGTVEEVVLCVGEAVGEKEEVLLCVGEGDGEEEEVVLFAADVRNDEEVYKNENNVAVSVSDDEGSIL